MDLNISERHGRLKKGILSLCVLCWKRKVRAGGEREFRVGAGLGFAVANRERREGGSTMGWHRLCERSFVGVSLGSAWRCL